MHSVTVELDDESKGKLNDLVGEFGLSESDVLVSCLEIVYQNVYTLNEPSSVQQQDLEIPLGPSFST